MDGDEIADKDVTRIGKLASRAFLKVEVFAYLILGLLSWSRLSEQNLRVDK